MVERRNGALVQQIHDLFGGGTVVGMDEGRLLERFVAQRDGAAFEALVVRFGPMVLGVCRRMLDEPHDVEDAFQATFLILVRKAGTIRDRDLLGNWLYGVAYRVATRARLNVRRRQRREVAWAEDQAVAPSESHEGEWRDLKRVLDEEVSRLPEKYRIPVCLCYLQDQSYEEAAQRLKWPIGTVRSRLAKARELMRARLVRRGVALPAGLLAAALQPRMTEAALTPALLEKTVTSALRVGAGQAASAVVARLTQEVLMSMRLVKLKWTAGLALVIGAAGTGVLVLANRTNEPADAVASLKQEAPPPTRPVLTRNGEPQPLPSPAADLSTTSEFVAQLKQHPAKPSAAAERNGLYLLDVDRGDVTLIAEEPGPGLTHCGSSCWSSDGGRILFDATPKAEWHSTHLESIALVDGRLARTDLGAGNCPSLAPNGQQIAFIMNSGAAPGAESGVWLMNADGSQRRRLGGYGRPKWSPDGRQLLVVAFHTPPKPTTLALMDVETGLERPLTISGQQVFTVPSWAGDGTIAAVIGTGDFADRIALLDVTNPDIVEVKATVWQADRDFALTPSYPVYSAATERCVFVGEKRKEPALYSVSKRAASLHKRLEATGRDHTIADLAMSPDGRYVIFCSDRPHPPRKSGAASRP